MGFYINTISYVAWMKQSGIRVYKLRSLDETKWNPGL